MGVRPRELLAPFLALNLPLIIMGEGVEKAQEMGLEQNKPGKENRDRPKNVGARRPWPILIAQGRG